MDKTSDNQEERKRDKIKNKLRTKISQAKLRTKDLGSKVRTKVKYQVKKINTKRKELVEQWRTKKFKTANMFTLLNAAAGLFCIFFAIRQDFALAATMLILSVAFDMLDGRIARLTGSTSDLGKELDSLADIVSFGVAPAVFAFTQNSSWFAIVSYVFFLSCGIIRLARFNIQQTQIYFYGMPITTNGYVIPIIYLFHPAPWIWPIVCIPLSLLMISRFKIKKIA